MYIIKIVEHLPGQPVHGGRQGEKLTGNRKNCRHKSLRKVRNIMAVKMLMKGAVLPGDSTVELKDFEVPVPGHGQVLVQTKATTICGSDIRCIYREHTGKGPEGYIPGMVAGHEPCGVIVEEGEGLKRFKKGDRVIVYHISGCGVCNDCRRGYYISCKSRFRQAYGWQRNGQYTAQ
mgnify:CR=1 FL=1